MRRIASGSILLMTAAGAGERPGFPVATGFLGERPEMLHIGRNELLMREEKRQDAVERGSPLGIEACPGPPVGCYRVSVG
jgi:hypothetical protein